MDKQKKQTILNVIIILATVMLMLIICSIVYEYLISKNTVNEVNAQNTPVNSTNNKVESEEKEEVPDETVTENNESDDEYVGQEEKESESSENDEKQSNDEKAIDLAKKEWGEDSSVQFSIEEKKENKYYIAVKSNATVVAWYEVNIDTWEISEFY